MVVTERIDNIENYMVVGTSAYLDITPGGKKTRRFQTNVHGWKPDQFLLVDRPEEVADSLLTEDSDYALSLFHNGDIIGFRTRLLETAVSGSDVLKLAWPPTARRMQLRKYERVTVSSVCRITTSEGKMAIGNLADISAGGCGFCTGLHLQAGQELHLSFAIPEGPQVEDLLVDICNQRVLPNGQTLYGCTFTLASQVKQFGIGLYVCARLAYERGTERPHPQVLILSQDKEDLILVRNVLSVKECEVVLTSDFVKVCQNMIKSPPDALMIRSNFPLITGSQAGHILHRSPGLKELPVVVYGGVGVSEEDEYMHHSMSLTAALDWLLAHCLADF